MFTYASTQQRSRRRTHNNDNITMAVVGEVDVRFVLSSGVGCYQPVQCLMSSLPVSHSVGLTSLPTLFNIMMSRTFVHNDFLFLFFFFVVLLTASFSFFFLLEKNTRLLEYWNILEDPRGTFKLNKWATTKKGYFLNIGLKKMAEAPATFTCKPVTRRAVHF